MSETPHVIYIQERAVYVQWDPRGPFVGLHESGAVTTQFREPHGARYQPSAKARAIIHARRAS